MSCVCEVCTTHARSLLLLGLNAGWALLIGFSCIAAFSVQAAMRGNLDPEGWDPVRDTVGAGVYGGKVKKVNGEDVWQPVGNTCLPVRL